MGRVAGLIELCGFTDANTMGVVKYGYGEAYVRGRERGRVDGFGEASRAGGVPEEIAVADALSCAFRVGNSGEEREDDDCAGVGCIKINRLSVLALSELSSSSFEETYGHEFSDCDRDASSSSESTGKTGGRGGAGRSKAQLSGLRSMDISARVSGEGPLLGWR